MVLIATLLLPNYTQHTAAKMLLDTCLPVLASGLVFSGFRRLVPRLGQRSRAFRQAQGSRQRMNDLLAALFRCYCWPHAARCIYAGLKLVTLGLDYSCYESIAHFDWTWIPSSQHHLDPQRAC